jgi:methylated-DNA-protein-cysteine methyltransferase related protein
MPTKGEKGPPGFYEAVYHLVREIPRGRVMTYGQIATILGQPRAARAVGYAMRACGQYGDDIPWQRVINHKGGISARSEVERPTKQFQLLKKEGVRFRDDETCDLAKYRWEPPDPDEYVFVTEKDMPFT